MVGVLDVGLAHPDVAAAGQAAQADVRFAAREGLLEPAEAVTVHPLARLRELHGEVLVTGLVLHRRVHGVDHPVHQLAHLVLLHGCPPWSLTGADATMGRPADVTLWIGCGPTGGRATARWSSGSWGRWRSVTGRGRSGCWRRRSRCGGGRRWPSSRIGRGRWRRRPGWRSCVWGRWSRWPRCGWPRVIPVGWGGWWGSWRGWWRPIRLGSGCGGC